MCPSLAEDCSCFNLARGKIVVPARPPLAAISCGLLHCFECTPIAMSQNAAPRLVEILIGLASDWRAKYEVRYYEMQDRIGDVSGRLDLCPDLKRAADALS